MLMHLAFFIHEVAGAIPWSNTAALRGELHAGVTASPARDDHTCDAVICMLPKLLALYHRVGCAMAPDEQRTAAFGGVVVSGVHL